MRRLNESLSLELAVCAAPRKSNSPQPDKCVVGFTSPRVRNENRLRRAEKRNSLVWLLVTLANGMFPKGVAISAPMKALRVTLAWNVLGEPPKRKTRRFRAGRRKPKRLARSCSERFRLALSCHVPT